MRKKVFFTLLFLTSIFIIYFLLKIMQTFSPSLNNTSDNLSSSPLPPTYKTLVFKDKTFAYEIAVIAPGREILIDYNQNQDSGYLLSTTLSCTYAINGGFYDTSHHPLGLLVYEREVLFPSIESQLFNGYFWIDANKNTYITETSPENPLYALQSGPILILDAQILPLEIRDDTPERRMVIAQTENNETVLLSLFDPSSLFVGPYLADAPSLTAEVAKAENIIIVNALNLDGGTASFFKNGDKTLSEFKAIGSIVCIR